MSEAERRSDERIKEEKEFKKMVVDNIQESRVYRAEDNIRQEFIKEQVTKTNGRVTALEDRQDKTEKWQADIENKIKERKEQIDSEIKFKNDRKDNIIIFINICIAAVTAVSAIVLLFKK